MVLKDEFLYLKLFKDVRRCDLDMLLPGTVVKFSWLDWVSAAGQEGWGGGLHCR